MSRSLDEAIGRTVTPHVRRLWDTRPDYRRLWSERAGEDLAALEREFPPDPSAHPANGSVSRARTLTDCRHRGDAVGAIPCPCPRRPRIEVRACTLHEYCLVTADVRRYVGYPDAEYDDPPKLCGLCTDHEEPTRERADAESKAIPTGRSSPSIGGVSGSSRPTNPPRSSNAG